MKKALFMVFGIISLLLMFFGFYLALFNFKKDWTQFWIFLAMCVAGFIGLSLIALFNILKKKKEPENK